MALIPEQADMLDLENEIDIEEAEEIAPSKTWRIDFKNGTIGGFIDEEEAKKQFVYKALITERNHYPIYTEAYGNDMFELIGADVTNAYLSTEIPRMCKEAILYDERVASVDDVTFERDSDLLYVNITVTLYTGETITVGEVVVNGL